MRSVVHKQNLEFLHHKSHYSFPYFQFMKNFLIINGNHIKAVLERNPHMTVCVCVSLNMCVNLFSLTPVGDGETGSSVRPTGYYVSLSLRHTHQKDP